MLSACKKRWSKTAPVSQEWLVVGEVGSEPSGRVPERDAGSRERVRLLFASLFRRWSAGRNGHGTGSCWAMLRKRWKTLMGLRQGSVGTLVGCELWGPSTQNIDLPKTSLAWPLCMGLASLMCLALLCLMCICWLVLCVGFSVCYLQLSVCVMHSFHGLCCVCSLQPIFEGQLSEWEATIIFT